VSLFVSEPVQIILVLIAGFFTGVLSGMFGVGGAVVSTPAIRALGATPIESIGSTLPSIIPSAISGSLRYHRDGLIHPRVVLWTALVGCSAAVGGALLADVVPGNGHLLMILTAALLAFTAFRTAQSPERPDPADAEAPPPSQAPDDADPPLNASTGGLWDSARMEWWRLGAIGLAAGGLSGLLGVGGGILMVPAFVGWVRMPIKAAVGCSLACVGILAVPGTITHALLGHIDWAFALPLCIAVIPGARVGAHLAIRSSERALRLSVAIVLGTIAVIYAVGEILALV
jgi:uncharacterized membrane protein YfcA